MGGGGSHASSQTVGDVWLVPYLNVPKSVSGKRKIVRVGSWSFRSAEEIANEEWLSDDFRLAVAALIRKYAAPSVLVGRFGDDLIGSSAFDVSSSTQIELALFFGMLAAQLRYIPASPPQWGMQTADNTEVHVWPIDCARLTFAVTRGGYVRTLSGGWDLSDDSVRIPRPLETHVDLFGAGLLDNDLATDALALMSTAQRLHFETVVHWLSKAWRNSPSVTMSDRIVFLKTACEAYACLDHANGPKEREKLRDRYGQAQLRLGDSCLLSKGALPGLEPTLELVGKWRNSVIHEGRDPADLYERIATVFSGPCGGDPVAVTSRLLCDLLRLDLEEGASQRTGP